MLLPEAFDVTAKAFLAFQVMSNNWGKYEVIIKNVFTLHLGHRYSKVSLGKELGDKYPVSQPGLKLDRSSNLQIQQALTILGQCNISCSLLCDFVIVHAS